jgi:CBS domain containing-hemolysin-like protein
MKIKALAGFLLGWLVPGLGHVVQKKYLRGLTFFVCIWAMTALGLVMGGKIYPLQAQNPLTVLAFFADVGNGLVYLLSMFLPLGTGVLKNVTFEFGTAYLAGAGLLNYLVALDAFDIGIGKKK